MMDVIVSLPARRDAINLLRISRTEFGRGAHDRYQRLIRRAFRDLGADPVRLGVWAEPGLPPSVVLYHLRHSRSRVATGARIAKPRHVIAFRVVGDAVEILRCCTMRWISNAISEWPGQSGE